MLFDTQSFRDLFFTMISNASNNNALEAKAVFGNLAIGRSPLREKVLPLQDFSTLWKGDKL